MADQTRDRDIRDISLILLDTGHDVADNGFRKPPSPDFDILLNFPNLTHLPGLRFYYGMDNLIVGAFWQLLAFFRTKEVSLGDVRHSLATRLRHYFTKVVHLIQRRGSALIPRVSFVTELNEVLRYEPCLVLDPQFWHFPRDQLAFHLALIKIFARARTAFLVKPSVTVIEAANTDVCMELTDVLDSLTITLQGRKIWFQGVQKADSNIIGMHHKARWVSYGDPKPTHAEEAESSLSVTGDTDSSAVPTPATSTAPSEDLDRVSRREAESAGSPAGGDTDPKQASPESQQPATDPSNEILQLKESLANLEQSLKVQRFASQKQEAKLRAKLRTQEEKLFECRVANEKLWEALREKENEALKEEGITGAQWESEDMHAFLEDLVEEDN